VIRKLLASLIEVMHPEVILICHKLQFPVLQTRRNQHIWLERKYKINIYYQN
jgi:hypothetical protein